MTILKVSLGVGVCIGNSERIGHVKVQKWVCPLNSVCLRKTFPSLPSVVLVRSGVRGHTRTRQRLAQRNAAQLQTGTRRGAGSDAARTQRTAV